MNLSDIKPPKGQVKKQRRVGQGMGSGRGKFSGRGAKGARSISGYSLMRGFEGGQMPLHRRLPKRGFTNVFREEWCVVNLGRLEKLDGSSFSPEKLIELGVVSKLEKGLKILSSGELTRAITVHAHAFSAEAKKKIEAAGGTAELIVVKAPAPIVRKPKVVHPAPGLKSTSPKSVKK
jgi:large subunit ribosomal protein L15